MSSRQQPSAGWSERWFSERESPLWICTGGPHDGKQLPTSQRAGVYRDGECLAAGGVYRLANKREGRFSVPTAIWTPIRPQSDGSQDINRMESHQTGEG